MSVVVEVGPGGFGFCAAHTGRHAGRFEPLHGHMFQVRLRVCGQPDQAGMVMDFATLKAALRQAVGPLRRRTLLAAADADPADPDGLVRFGDAVKRYALPAADLMLLPVGNTTTEELAGYLLDRLAPVLSAAAGLVWAELVLAEAPGVAARVRRSLC